MKRKSDTDGGMNQRTVRQWLILRVVQSVQSETIQILYLMFTQSSAKKTQSEVKIVDYKLRFGSLHL